MFTIKRFISSLDKFNYINFPNTLRVLVFGGALDSNSFRNKLLCKLKSDIISNKFLLTLVPDKINYFDISTTDKYDLIEKETRLFENADVLIIILESAGSFSEIGMISYMIANHEKMKDRKKVGKKVLVVVDSKFKHDDSFIKFGPLKIISKLGGKICYLDFESTNYSEIIFQLNKYNTISGINIKLPEDKIIFEEKKHEIFFINCIKVLLYIYSKKSIECFEYYYKYEFIKNLKFIDYGIEHDNIEYLESTELIKKINYDAKILIEVNHKHPFIKSFIDKNLNEFLENKLINRFLGRSGY